MKKNLLSLLLVLLFSIMVYALEAPSDVDANTVLLPGNNILIRDDFDVLNYPMCWDKKGVDAWKVGLESEFDITTTDTSNKVLCQSAVDLRRIIFQGNFNWDNYIVAAKAKVLELGVGGNDGIMIPFRVQNTNKLNTYALRLMLKLQVVVEIVKFEDGSITQSFPITKINDSFDLSVWHHYAVSVKGLDFTVFIDNKKAGKNTDSNPNPYRLGRVGLGTQDTSALFDEFLVVSLNGALTDVPAYRAVALGQYNLALEGSSMTDWVPSDPLLVLGNGTDPTSRSNAIVIYKNGNVDLNGNLNLIGNVNIPGILTAGTVNTNLLNTVNETANSITTEELTVNQSTVLMGSVSIEGDITAPNISATESLNSQKSLNVDGSANLNGGAKITGPGGSSHSLDVEGNVIINGSTDITNTLTVTGTTSLNGANVTDLNVTGDAALVDVTANGTATLNTAHVANLTVNGDSVLEDLTVNGTATLNTTNVTDLNVTGDAALADVTASGTATLNTAHVTDLTVTGDAALADVTANGTATLNDANVTDLTVSGTTNLKNTEVTGLTVTGAETISGNLTVNGTTVLNAGGTVNGGDLAITGGDLSMIDGNKVALGVTGGTAPITLSYGKSTTNVDSLAVNDIAVIDKNGNWVGPPAPSEPITIVTSKTITGTIPMDASSYTLPQTIREMGIDPTTLVDVNAFIQDVSGIIIRKLILPFDSEFGDALSYKLSLKATGIANDDYQIVLTSIGENLRGNYFSVSVLWEKIINIPSL